jgi:hypothetical protein
MLLGPSGRWPVTGCRFSFSAVVKVGLLCDVELVDEDRTLIELIEVLLDGASWKTVKVRRDILDQFGLRFETNLRNLF